MAKFVSIAFGVYFNIVYSFDVYYDVPSNLTSESDRDTANWNGGADFDPNKTDSRTNAISMETQWLWFPL